MRWSRGDAVAVRYFENDHVTGALAVRVIEDSERAVALYLADGTRVKWPSIDGRHVRESTLDRRFSARKEPGDHCWTGAHVLLLSPPGRAHAIWHFFTSDWIFEGWYVNLEAPYRRAECGFDTRDHTLDISIEADGSWVWKDEDELEFALSCGYYSRREAEAIRAEGERVVAEWPFPTGWEEWRPDPQWSVPALPTGWDVV